MRRTGSTSPHSNQPPMSHHRLVSVPVVNDG
jgi:hypothetical protein